MRDGQRAGPNCLPYVLSAAMPPGIPAQFRTKFGIEQQAADAYTLRLRTSGSKAVLFGVVSIKQG